MPPVVIDVRSAEDPRDIVHRAVQAVTEGKLVVFPTETVYGLAARALDVEAVGRLLAVKGRSSGHPLTLAIKSADEARDYAPDMGPLGQRFARRCWPGPVTLVLDNSHPESLVKQLPPEVQAAVSPGNTVGLRVPGHPIILDVLRMAAGPLVLTSANRTGQPDTLDVQQVIDSLGEDVQLIVDDGPCRYGEPSSVVRVTDGTYEILRGGVVPEPTLRRLASPMVLFVCTGNTCRSPMAETLFRKQLADRLGCQVQEVEERGVMVMSAGVAAMNGGRASREASEVMTGMGLDLSQHETQPLGEPLVRYADRIYTMTHSHRQALLSQWPEAAARTEVLCADGSDVSDPIGGPIERYQRCAEQLHENLKIRLDELKL